MSRSGFSGESSATGDRGLVPASFDESSSRLKEMRGLSQPYEGYVARGQSRKFSGDIPILLMHAEAISKTYYCVPKLKTLEFLQRRIA